MTGREKVTIRRMVNADIEAILTLDRKIGSGESVVNHKDLELIGIGGPFDLSQVAEIDGHVIGFLLARVEYVSIPLTKICSILGVAVDSEYRRHGVGAGLLHALLDECYESGVVTARALVDEHNENLRQFIIQSGFNKSDVANYDLNFEYLTNRSATRHW